LAFCKRIESCIRTGELSNPSTSAGILAFLEVQTGTGLTIDYWAGWASALCNYTCVVPNLCRPFRPCIICDFVPTTPAGPPYALDQKVRDCLDSVAATYTRSPIYCRGFWAHAIEELKTRQVNNSGALGLLFRAKEDGGGEDALKTLDHATIMGAILRQPEELEELGGA
jgi:hypothetical protein